MTIMWCDIRTPNSCWHYYHFVVLVHKYIMIKYFINVDGIAYRMLTRSREGNGSSPLAKSSWDLYGFVCCLCSLRTHVRWNEMKWNNDDDHHHHHHNHNQHNECVQWMYTCVYKQAGGSSCQPIVYVMAAWWNPAVLKSIRANRTCTKRDNLHSFNVNALIMTV